MKNKKTENPSCTERKLGKGTMRIYNFDGIRLHAYGTNDPFVDQSFLFETHQELIGLESPLFRDNLTEYADYIRSLDKPFDCCILAYHPGGSDILPKTRFYTTETAKKAMLPGGSVKAMIDEFSGIFGDKIDTDIPKAMHLIKAGRVTLGNIEFIVKDTKEGFDLEIPAINAVYTHMVGAHCHNILESPRHIDTMIKQMEEYEGKKYSLILTTHDIPEPVKIAGEKKAYLKKIKQLVLNSRDRDRFIAEAKKNFPGYAGENYLEMSAKALFKA
ncbi:MAG: hypothetical protein LBN21_01420 [Treponema sp.]|jgi:hypothetical protein|nr:hypothetical protein [Treponema sp.]